jgi:hypothetical protein
MSGVSTQAIAELEAGLDSALNKLETGLGTVAYAKQLPILGPQLQAAFNAGQTALQGAATLKSIIDSVLNGLTDPAGYAASTIADDLNTALANAGFGGSVVAGSSGSQVTLQFQNTQNTSFNASVAGDLGLSGLELQAQGNASVALHYGYNFTVGVDVGNPSGSFFLQTGANPLLSLGVDVSAPSFTADANLGNLKLAAAIDDPAGGPTTGVHANFALSVDNPSNLGQMSVGQLQASGIDADLTGSAAANLHLSADMGSAALPSISADMNASWTLGGNPTLSFNNVSYDFGSFVENFISPILHKVDPILEPVQKAIAVLNTDITFLDNIPGLKDVLDVAGGDNGGSDAADGKITLIDFVKLADPSLDLVPALQFIGIVQDIVDWAAFFEGRDFGPRNTISAPSICRTTASPGPFMPWRRLTTSPAAPRISPASWVACPAPAMGRPIRTARPVRTSCKACSTVRLSLSRSSSRRSTPSTCCSAATSICSTPRCRSSRCRSGRASMPMAIRPDRWSTWSASRSSSRG